MEVLSVRNVHQALPSAVHLLQRVGVDRESRNGPVKVAPWPVITEYTHPLERVVFWPARDANPFLHLYESLWMLAGRNDIAPLVRYAKNFSNYSADGETQPGAYGKRWRGWFVTAEDETIDQLSVISARLRRDPHDRRCVLQMWDTGYDLDAVSPDVPCNLTATVQRGPTGAVDLTVFCRSNDIVWGAYGANAVHFAFLLEYLAAAIGCQAGTYRHISVNWHAYAESFAQVAGLAREVDGLYSVPSPPPNPYCDGDVRWVPMVEQDRTVDPREVITRLDMQIAWVLHEADHGFPSSRSAGPTLSPLLATAYHVLRAHHHWKTTAAPARYELAAQELRLLPPDIDWVVAAREWVGRRRAAWEAKLVSA